MSDDAHEEPSDEKPAPSPEACDEIVGVKTRIVAVVGRLHKGGWEIEVDYGDEVSDAEAYAMLEYAYFVQRSYLYPGMFPDPTATPPWAVDDDEEEEAEQDDD